MRTKMKFNSKGLTLASELEFQIINKYDAVIYFTISDDIVEHFLFIIVYR